jgi:hypothetical protein
MFMKLYAGCFKNPQYIPILDKLHNINWVLFTGGMRLGCEADNLPLYVKSEECLELYLHPPIRVPGQILN